MVQIVKEPGIGETIGSQFGTGLSSGTNTGLQLLINQRLSDLQQRGVQQRLKSGLEPIFGEQAHAYSNLPLELLQPAVKEKLKSSQRLESTGPGFKLIAPELNEEQAEKISKLPPGVQQAWYRNYIENPRAATEALNKTTPQELQRINQMNQMPIQEQEELSNLQQMVHSQSGIQQLLQQPRQPSLQEQLLGSLPGLASGIGTRSFNVPETSPEIAAGNKIQNQQIQKVIKEEPKKVSDYMKEGFSKSEAQELFKNQVKQSANSEKAAKEEQKYIDQQTLAYYDKTSAFNEGAKMADLRLNKMENLIKKGELPTAAVYNSLKRIEELSPSTGATAGGIVGGLLGAGAGTAGGPAGTIAGQLAGRGIGAAVGAGIGALISPVATILRSGQRLLNQDQEQFEKLSADFIREAKNIFGSRITDADLAYFTQLIPTLSQTDNGKLAIINNLKMFNEASKIKYNNMIRLIKSNGNKRPANLDILVEDLSKPELDKLAKRFETV